LDAGAHRAEHRLEQGPAQDPLARRRAVVRVDEVERLRCLFGQLVVVGAAEVAGEHALAHRALVGRVRRRHAGSLRRPAAPAREALEVHYQTIGYLERGECSPSLELALRIAEYFEVPLEVVFSLRPFPRLG